MKTLRDIRDFCLIVAVTAFAIIAWALFIDYLATGGRAGG